MVAERRDVPLEHIEVTIDGYRDKGNPSYFQKVEMQFDLRGVDADQAQKLVAAYQGY